MDRRNILILLGKRGSGKTSLAKLIESKEHFKHIEMSQYLITFKESLGFKDIVLRNFVEKFMKEEGSTFLISNLITKCIESNKTDVVLTGVRHISEIDFIKSALIDSKLVFVYLKVCAIERFFRILKRNERSSLWQFVVEEYYSYKWGDKSLRKSAIKYVNKKNIKQALSDILGIIDDNK